MLNALILLVFASTTVAEPNTAVTFDTTITLGEQMLNLTGVDRRRALGRDAYAVAHYIGAVPGERRVQSDAEGLLDQYINAATHKVLVFHGVYKNVPAHGIRHSWRKHFKDLGIAPREDFVDVFQSPFIRGERLYFIANPDGHLEVRHGDRVLGQWDDPTLVRALWAMCLGPTTEIVERTKLASLQIPPQETADRDPAKEPARP